MELRPLGRTGVEVSALTLGAMNFGSWGNTDHDESVAMIRRALDAGVNVVDTADVYGGGDSERIVGVALAGRRDDVVLTTKFFGPMKDRPNHAGVSRRWIMREVENSLRRLRTDWIDVYQVHRPDPDVELDDTLGALSDLVRHGKIRYYGTSSFLPGQIVKAQWVAQTRCRDRPATEQPPYSVLARGIEREVLPLAREYGLGVLTWSPLAGGWLSGRYRSRRPVTSVSTRRDRQADRHDHELPANETKLRAVHALTDLAHEAGLTIIELALAFVLGHRDVSSVIIGPRTPDHLEAALAAQDIRLTSDVLDRIDEIVAPGVMANPADWGYQPPSIRDPRQRRRS
jgi:aryl-alcohol dehydrogenase-like predicted oxidoreductase